MSEINYDVVIELYRINISQNRFDKIDEIQTYKNLRWFDRLNGVGSAAFSLEIQDSKAEQTNWKRYITQVAIRVNNLVVWVGHVDKVSANYKGVKGKKDIRCLSYLGHLLDRKITKRYTTQDASLIAWDMIDTVQSRTNGELMIREGSLDTVGDTSDTLQNQSVANALINQSDNLIGYDFEFKPTQGADGLLDEVTFNLYDTIGVTRDSYAPLEFGFNVNGASYVTSSEIYNNVTGEGAGTATDVISASYSDGASQLEYTRRETIKPYKNIRTYQTLNLLTENYLDRVKDESYTVGVDLMPNGEYRYGAFGIGDYLPLNLEFPDGTVFDQNARVVELGANVDDEGVIYLEPKLETILI